MGPLRALYLAANILFEQRRMLPPDAADGLTLRL